MSLRPMAIVLTTLALLFTGCASDDAPSSDSAAPAATSQTESGKSRRSKPSREQDSPSGPTVDIAIEGGEFSPQAQRIQAKVGEPVTLNIDSDVAGEFHVHSDPEQEIAFKAGESTHEITIDQPGVVEVESHDLGGVILQLEVH